MERPLFRTDLVCKAVDAEGQRWVDVTDPDSGATFRFYEIEYAIACAMDGTRDLDGLLAWAEEELGIAPQRDELATVVSTLGELGYLSPLPVDVPIPDDAELVEPAAAAAPNHSGKAETPTDKIPVIGDASDDVELGAPGRSGEYDRAATARPGESISLELGLPGPPSQSAVVPRSETEAPTLAGDDRSGDFDADETVELGAAGAPFAADDQADDGVPDPIPPAKPTPTDLSTDLSADLSTDLSQQFEIKTADVKEAVRQSRVMTAVEVPEDIEMEADEPPDTDDRRPTRPMSPLDSALLEGIPSLPTVDEPTKPIATVDTSRLKPSQPVAGTSALDPDLLRQSQPISAPGEFFGSHPIEVVDGRNKPMILPESPARVGQATSAHAIEASQPKKASGSNILILVGIFMLVGLAAAAAYVYLNYFADDVGRVPPKPRDRTRPEEPAAAAKQPPAAAPTALTTTVEGETAVVASSQAGVVAWVAENGSSVTAGAPVAKLAGFDGVAKELARAEERLKVYQDAYDQAAARSDKAAMKAAEADVKRKQADITKAKAKLDALVVSAPSDGVVEAAVAARARIAAGAEVATITPAATVTARFAAPAGRTFAKGDDVTVALKAEPTKTVACKVSDTADGVVVACPAGSWAAGTQVMLP